MTRSLKHISSAVLLILICSVSYIYGQDNERPLSPQLTLVSVDPLSGFSHLYWSPGGSPDVAGYVVYLYNDEQGEAVDTIFNPSAVDYIYTKTFANNYTVDYVVAAIDSSDNTSPLSNPLSTIYLISSLDTCDHELILGWSEYNSFPSMVQSYNIFVSVDSGAEENLGSVDSEIRDFSYTDFETGSTYCFRVEANIEGGLVSSSNQSCIETDIIRPPLWINGSYANIDSQNNIEVSFTYDLSSEIELFRLERASSPSGPFTLIRDISNNSGTITEQSGVLGSLPVYYRLSAVNNCNKSVIFSNLVTAIPVGLNIAGDEVQVSWHEYYEFTGDLSEYRIYRVMNNQSTFLNTTSAGDTIFYEDISNFLYQNNEDRICYQVEAVEQNNPHSINSISTSQTSCIDTPVQIYVPNAFTPDGDLLNETFGPVLTFTPTRFRLFIKTLSGITVFSTENYLEQWDGTQGGSMLEPGVYLWFLELKTPGGKEIVKNGSVTIIFN